MVGSQTTENCSPAGTTLFKPGWSIALPDGDAPTGFVKATAVGAKAARPAVKMAKVEMLDMVAVVCSKEVALKVQWAA